MCTGSVLVFQVHTFSQAIALHSFGKTKNHLKQCFKLNSVWDAARGGVGTCVVVVVVTLCWVC